MTEAKKIIAGHIAKGNTDEALRSALEYFPQYADQLAVIQGSYARIQKKNMAGAMASDAYNVEVAQVTFRLLELLNAQPTNPSAAPKKNRLSRIINFQLNFFKEVIYEFARSRYVLFGSLFFILVVGVTTAIFISQIMPTQWGRLVLVSTLVAFFTLVMLSIGFINAQIKQFNGTQSFLSFQEMSSGEEGVAASEGVPEEV
jgi:hypothetical protein